MNIPHTEQKHNTNQLPLQHIGNIAYHTDKTATSYNSVNSLTTQNNHYTLLYPDLVQELFDLSLHESNSLKNNSLFLRNLSVNNAKSSSLDSSLSPRDILFFLQIVSLYQLELSKGNSAIVYSSLKLAKLLGVDASCDTAHLTSSAHNSVNSLTDANIRATILRMTAKLEALGLLKVFRRKRKNGADMANKLIPVLPDSLHTRIKDSPSNLKVSDSSKLEHESNLEHILRTKLFVPIELDFMKSLFKNNLPSKYKLFFLNCIMSAYRNFRHNSSGSDILSFSATSSELIKKNNISKRTLFNIFKYIKQQGDSFFLQVEHKYTKSDDIDSNRYDKSIFVISINPLVFPISQIKLKEEITEFNHHTVHDTNSFFVHDTNSFFVPDTYRGFREEVQKKQPRSAKKTALNNKEEIIKNKYNRNIDANIDKNIDEKKEALDRQAKNNQIKLQTFLQTSNSEHLESEQSSLSSKSLKNIVKDFIDALPFPSNNNAANASSTIQDISDKKNKINIPNKCNTVIHNKTTSQSKAINDRKNKDLRYFYPLSEKDANMLNFKANREFSTNFTNQLLLKLYIKDPEKRFKNKFTFSSYMIKALKNEHHQGPRVNNPSFRFSCNIDEQEKRVLECEQYLSKVESSSDTCKISQVKKKIAGRFSSEVAYKILTGVAFKLNPDNSFITALMPSSLALSKRQIATLSDQLEAVYGINGYYVQELEKEVIQPPKSRTRDIDPKGKPIDILAEGSTVDTAKENTTWHQIRKSLREEFGEAIDTVWFSKAKAIECRETSLLLLTMPTRFMADWVRNNYSHAIRRLAGSVGVKMVEYEYEQNNRV